MFRNICRCHPTVTRTLYGCHQLCGRTIVCKQLLCHTKLAVLKDTSLSTGQHDDLFFVILTVGFHSLMHLRELVWPDKAGLQDYCKVILQHTVKLLPNGFSFHLPGHKADQFFRGQPGCDSEEHCCGWSWWTFCYLHSWDFACRSTSTLMSLVTPCELAVLLPLPRWASLPILCKPSGAGALMLSRLTLGNTLSSLLHNCSAISPALSTADWFPLSCTLFPLSISPFYLLLSSCPSFTLQLHPKNCFILLLFTLTLCLSLALYGTLTKYHLFCALPLCPGQGPHLPIHRSAMCEWLSLVIKCLFTGA